MALGIYKITNIVNNKIYIGSTNNFKRRITEHKRTFKDGKSNKYLNNSVNKHGISRVLSGKNKNTGGFYFTKKPIL
ncbi:GIY-YIG nuclease family protein [Listeria monocytogenes]|uniref:GIY-YIG nuclease family protein n=1 Tax=Listeria monocytogenes TaxID=1639 RepID=UPI002FDC34E3